MLLADLVAVSAVVAATPSRSAKVGALADLLRRLGPDEVATAVAVLPGAPRQGRISVGWRQLAGGHDGQQQDEAPRRPHDPGSLLLVKPPSTHRGRSTSLATSPSVKESRRWLAEWHSYGIVVACHVYG